MTMKQPVRTRAEFERRLTALVESAADNGVDPRGSWRVRQSTEPPDYEALVTRVVSDQ